LGWGIIRVVERLSITFAVQGVLTGKVRAWVLRFSHGCTPAKLAAYEAPSAARGDRGYARSSPVEWRGAGHALSQAGRRW